MALGVAALDSSVPSAGRLTATADAAGFRAPGPGAGERTLAARECREKSFEDPAEFRFDYGRGPGALNRCIAAKLRKAHFECRQKAAEEPYEFRGDYGTGPAAQRRCVRDELD